MPQLNYHAESVRERDRDRQRDRQIKRETDRHRQTDRQTDRQTGMGQIQAMLDRYTDGIDGPESYSNVGGWMIIVRINTCGTGFTAIGLLR